MNKILIAIGGFIFGFAQIPQYYADVDFTLTGEALKQQLAQLITTTHTTNLVYTSSILPDTWLAVRTGDRDPSNTDNVLLIYGWNDTDGQFTTDRTRNFNASCHTSSCNGLWVREHVFPRSLGTPNLGSEFAGADAHNLRAIDNQRNNLRSNRIFDLGSGVSSMVLPNGNWFPGDEWKGDVARIIMYMYVRYPTQCAATSVGAGATSFATLGDMPNIFLIWNQEDPVSQLEINRNNFIASLQGNRNPFIDNPYIATMIWNGPAATDTWTVLSNQHAIVENLVVYPTITFNHVWVTNQSTNAINFNYTVTNPLGQTIQKGTSNKEINVSEIPQGMYWIQIQIENQTKSFKIIKK